MAEKKTAKKKTPEKEKFNVTWHKGGIVCSVCGTKKNLSEERFEKLKQKRMINKYVCRNCKRKAKEEAEEKAK